MKEVSHKVEKDKRSQLETRVSHLRNANAHRFQPLYDIIYPLMERIDKLGKSSRTNELMSVVAEQKGMVAQR